jgi:hypothetical protein
MMGPDANRTCLALALLGAASDRLSIHLRAPPTPLTERIADLQRCKATRVSRSPSKVLLAGQCSCRVRPSGVKLSIIAYNRTEVRITSIKIMLYALYTHPTIPDLNTPPHSTCLRHPRDSPA